MEPAIPIYNNPDEAWLTIRQTLEDVDKFGIPIKICTVYSKPFWYKLLTDISNSLTELQKQFKCCSTLKNHAALKDAREKFRNRFDSQQHVTGLKRHCKVSTMHITGIKSGKKSKRSSSMKETEWLLP